MPHGYCTECRAQVTVRAGRCLLDHSIEPSTIVDTPGRRLRAGARRRRRHLPPARDHRAESVSAAAAAILRSERVPERVPELVGAGPAAPPPPPPAPPSPGVHSVTGSLVEELWNLSPDEDIDGWTPSGVDEWLVRTGVRTRKAVIIAALAIAVVAFGWRALTWDGAQLSAAVESIEAADRELATAVAGLAPVAEDLADGTIEDPLTASTGLGRVDETARRLFTLVAELPDTEEAQPTRDRAVAASSGALEFESLLSGVVAYGAAVDRVARPIDLPDETDLDGLAVTTESVAEWVTTFQSGVESLPSNDLVDTHRAGLSELAASMPAWQAAYLDSLRARDPERSAAHIAELETQIQFVRESWEGTARSIATWAERRVTELTSPADAP